LLLQAVLKADTDEIIFGGDGDDFLDASTGGWNTLYGRDANDILVGGVDLLLGENGDDALFAGNGGTTLTGGDGKDQFWVASTKCCKHSHRLPSRD